MQPPPAGELSTLAVNSSSDIRDFFPEGGGQIDLMVLFVHQDLANLFRQGKFSQSFTLPDALAVISNGRVSSSEGTSFGRGQNHAGQLLELPNSHARLLGWSTDNGELITR